MKNNYLIILLTPLFLTACAGNVNHRWCPPTEIVESEAVPQELYEETVIELSADALFKFDKSGINDLLAEGKAELDNVILQLKNNYVTVKQVDITGHTDRLGSEQYNYKLGMQRAETIRDYLKSNGVQSTMNVSSQGKSEPVTVSCTEALGKEALRACLQLDRRVTLNLIGVKKTK
jgi:OmpA-OmpF porin, OOP family